MDFKPLPEPPAKDGGNASASLPPMRRITRAPIVEYSYPAGFPDADANCVESEQIQADREFNENMAAGCSFREHEKLHRRRIMRVFLTFALRACNLKTPGPWSIVRIRSEVAEFVEAQVTAAGMDWNRPEVRESFEKTPEWAAYEDALLMAASGEGGLPKANQSGATEPSGNESTRTEEGPAVNGTNGNGADRRVAIDAFISKLAETGRKVTRKDVWTVAGYKSRTEFERFQRGDKRTTRAASLNFNRVLGMTPEHFIRALEKKASK